MYSTPVLGQLADQRTAVTRSAATGGAGCHQSLRATTPRSTVRHRTGWTLVELGLRLAGSDARR